MWMGKLFSVQRSAFSSPDLTDKPFVLAAGKEGFQPASAFLSALALNNDVQTDQDGNLIGDSTELALFHWAAERGFGKKELEEIFPRTGEIPFDADRKCMTTIHRVAGVKGPLAGNHLLYQRGRGCFAGQIGKYPDRRRS